jgi:hypothetical protein
LETRGKITICLLALLMMICGNAHAQKHRGRSVNDTLLLSGIVTDDGDTLAMILLPEVEVWGRYNPKYAREHAREIQRNNELRYNVYKVYPYAVVAAGILKDVDVKLAALDGNKRAQKAYLKSVEKELNDKFKGQLEDLSITQGQILVRLIDRQTGKNCYSIIKELKGGFSAVIWQSVALLFSNNLKREYDPEDRDKDIEQIVRELEASNYNRYEYYKQQMQIHN